MQPFAAGLAWLMMSAPLHCAEVWPPQLPNLPVLLESGAQTPNPAAVAIKDPLAEAFLAKLSFEGTPEERAVFRTYVDLMLQSPTARELAAQFARSARIVTARFEDFPGTGLYDRKDGRLAFDASEAAHVVFDETKASIALNRACLKIDPEYAAEICVRHLAHEALGHTLGWVLAGPSGLQTVYSHYDSEFFARLVDWNVILDLTGSLHDPEVYCAVKDPAAYPRGLKRHYPYSAWSLSVDELRDPEKALRARLSQIQRRLADPAEKNAAGLKRMAVLIDQELSALDYARAQSGQRERFQTAAEQPFFIAFQALTEKLRLSLAARSGQLLQYGTCEDYY